MTQDELSTKVTRLQNAAKEVNEAFVDLVGKEPRGITGFHAQMAVNGFNLFEYCIMNLVATQGARTDEAMEKAADEALKNGTVKDATGEGEQQNPLRVV